MKAALEAGKHVLVEKPITTHSGEADELVALAERHRRVLVVGHVFLFNLAVQRVRGYIAAGDLGRVYYVSMVRTNLGPIRVDVNAAWDLMSHDISIVNYWLGARARDGVGGRRDLDQRRARGRRVRDAALPGRRAGERARLLAEPAQVARRDGRPATSGC